MIMGCLTSLVMLVSLYLFDGIVYLVSRWRISCVSVGVGVGPCGE